MATAVALDRGFLKDKRRKAGVTLDDLALALGLKPDSARPALSRWERSKGELPGDVAPEQYERAVLNLVRDAERAARKSGASK